MCIFSPPQDNSAQIARQQEEARQAAITSGTQRVNDVFSKFDDNFYNGVTKASNDYYLPQIDNQYKNAHRDLVLALGSSGILNGSAGARQLGQLDQEYQTQRGNYANQGVAAAQSERGTVEKDRADILSQLSASADPSAAAATASAQAASLTAPPVFSPIGQLFSSFATQGANNIAAARLGYPNFASGLFRPGTSSGGGSFKNVS